jgi:PAS domain S-box-containing protein
MSSHWRIGGTLPDPRSGPGLSNPARAGVAGRSRAAHPWREGALWLGLFCCAGGMTAAMAIAGWLPVLPAHFRLPGQEVSAVLGQVLVWLALAAAGMLAFGGALYLNGRRREASLRRANAVLEARLLALTDRAEALDLTAVILRAPDGTIRHWSLGCERLFGFSAAEALGRASHELLGTRFPDGGRRTVQDEMLRTGEWQGELRHRRRNGQPVVVAAHWILRRDAADRLPSAVIEVHADATALKAAEAALSAGEARLRLAQEVAGVGTWEWEVEADSFVWSPEQHALFGTSPAAGAPQSYDAFLALVHPEDREQLRMAACRALESGEYEAEFRILRPGRNGSEDIRWLIGRGRRMPGLTWRMGPILGVNVDITARKEAEERQALLMREVDHRAKNALAVVQAVLRLTRADSPDSFARAVEGRVAALARAQTLLTESRWVGADLLAMLRGELAPFMDMSGGARVTLEGPPVTVAPVTAQPLSMTLHELATNAAKYGSLSVPEGRLALSWWIDAEAGRLMLRWVETGGPAIAVPPSRGGFGSRLIQATVREQLGGEVALQWEPSGLVCDIGLPLHRAVARDMV